MKRAFTAFWAFCDRHERPIEWAFLLVITFGVIDLPADGFRGLLDFALILFCAWCLEDRGYAQGWEKGWDDAIEVNEAVLRAVFAAPTSNHQSERPQP